MRVLKTDGGVVQLRFLADGQKLLTVTSGPDGAAFFNLITVATGESVRLTFPASSLRNWWASRYSNALAVHPGGEWFYITWDGVVLSYLTADGSPRPLPDEMTGRQVIVSASGDRLLLSHRLDGFNHKVWAYAIENGRETKLWELEMGEEFRQLAGVMRDGERFVTIEDKLRIRHLDDGRELAATRHKINGDNQPQVSRDGRHVSVLGYGSMYVIDLETLAKPRQIKGSGNFGNFVSSCFHPANGTMAVIHGGPTLVKIYDVATLEQTLVFKWKLGPLGAVTFSPDGLLGAAGSADGQIVIWDVD